MTTLQKYPREQVRSLYFDVNGKKVSEPSQHTTPAHNPWRVLDELENEPQPELTR
jgi:hypothetical protein